MIEILLSCANLLSTGLMSLKDYNIIIDKFFLEMPDDAMLLDLEFASSNINETISIIYDYCIKRSVDYNVFGRYLFDGLKRAYYDYGMDIKDFASKVYALWGTLPSNIYLNEPFRTMSYADDPLSWGDEQQTRKLYEEMLRFYDEK